MTVLLSLDDVSGATYRVYDEEDDRHGVYGNLDTALEAAEAFADNGVPEEVINEIAIDEESDGFVSDVEADGDVLASAGWGTDEDYGYYGEM